MAAKQIKHKSTMSPLKEQEADRIRREIEIGWQQSERGEVVDGPSVFAEIRTMSERRGAAAGLKR